VTGTIQQTLHLAFINPEIPRLVNFTIFVVILVYLLRKPVTQFFRDRVQKIIHDLDRAQAERESARARLRQIELRLNRIEDEIQELNTRAAAEAEAEEARIKAAAEAEAEKLRALSRREIESSMNAARLELKSFAAAQAVELAKNIIRREMSDEDHHRLITHFNEQIEEVRP
jgi:F-type H+-transporting ATPase subunit b